VEAIVDRLIPADELAPGGKDLGCAVFVDRQLAGPCGRNGGLYMQGPFQHGTKRQGMQSDITPSEYYRRALPALSAHCQQAFGMKFCAKMRGRRRCAVPQASDDCSQYGTGPRPRRRLVGLA
jgi:gluconate 2-dehydrogenase gamma chain